MFDLVDLHTPVKRFSICLIPAYSMQRLQLYGFKSTLGADLSSSCATLLGEILKTTRLPEYSPTRRVRLNRGKDRNACYEDAIMGLSPTKNGKYSHC